MWGYCWPSEFCEEVPEIPELPEIPEVARVIIRLFEGVSKKKAKDSLPQHVLRNLRSPVNDCLELTKKTFEKDEGEKISYSCTLYEQSEPFCKECKFAKYQASLFEELV